MKSYSDSEPIVALLGAMLLLVGVSLWWGWRDGPAWIFATGWILSGAGGALLWLWAVQVIE